MAGSAGDRTEKPTQRKLKESREKGQIARSRDLSGALSLVAVTIALGWFGSRLTAGLGDRMRMALESLGHSPLAVVDGSTLSTLVWTDTARAALLSVPVLLVAGLTSVGGSIAQGGWNFSPKAAHFNWERLSPAQGFAKFKPAQAGAELVKALVGMAVLGVVCYLFVRQAYDLAPRLAAMAPGDAMRAGWDQVWRLLWQGSLTLLVLGAGDFALQHWRWYAQVKMTRQEVRDDARHQDGSPEVRARVRKVQREMTRRRMLQAVKKATVVITNPTHYAVAITYRRAEMVAPVVVAKGQDLLAARIREVARKHGVPVVENVALARALYKGAEVGDTIPAALFGAVAEVLAYLVRLKQLFL